jgi:hypothetical protein
MPAVEAASEDEETHEQQAGRIAGTDSIIRDLNSQSFEDHRARIHPYQNTPESQFIKEERPLTNYNAEEPSLQFTHGLLVRIPTALSIAYPSPFVQPNSIHTFSRPSLYPKAATIQPSTYAYLSPLDLYWASFKTV